MPLPAIPLLILGGGITAGYATGYVWSSRRRPDGRGQPTLPNRLGRGIGDTLAGIITPLFPFIMIGIIIVITYVLFMKKKRIL